MHQARKPNALTRRWRAFVAAEPLGPIAGAAFAAVFFLRLAGFAAELGMSWWAGFPARSPISDAAHVAPELIGVAVASYLLLRGRRPHWIGRAIAFGLLASGTVALLAAFGLEPGANARGGLAAVGVMVALGFDMAAALALVLAWRKTRRKELEFEAIHVGVVDVGLIKAVALTGASWPGADMTLAVVIVAVTYGLAAILLSSRLKRRLAAWPPTRFLAADVTSAER